MAPTHHAPPSSLQPSNYPSTTPPSILLAIIDIHPLSWSLLSHLAPLPTSEQAGTGSLDKVGSTPMSLHDFVTVLMVFLNAHLASRWGNEVVVYAASAGKAKLLYPPPPSEVAGPSTSARPNSYRPFQLLDTRIEDGLKEMIAEEEARLQDDPTGLNDTPAMVSALTKALCFINRINPPINANANTDAIDPAAAAAAGAAVNPDRPETRILVVNATPGSTISSAINTNGTANGEGDHPAGELDASAEGKAQEQGRSGGQMRGGYVGLMNCVFAAQKAKVPIDVLSLPPPSIDSSPPIFLQQAAHLTEGIWWQWNGRGGLLQYLHGIYLPPPSLRQHPFATPPQDAVGFRAVCFCHHKTLDVGFVCSVCLSIFCEPRPVCLMCKTKFPLKSIPILRQLANHIQPIPVPDTIIIPPQPKPRNPPNPENEGKTSGAKKRRASNVAGAGSAAGGGRGEPIEVD